MNETTYTDSAEQEPQVPGSELFYWLQTLVIALVSIVLIFTFVGRVTRVDGHSMDPSLAHGELLMVWSLGYQPEVGDIVVVNKTITTFLGGEAIVKRIIATEGQTVHIDYDTATVFVDGEPLEEPYILEPMKPGHGSLAANADYVVPEGSVFLMGDNRNGSSDSRVPQLGAVDEGYILGKAMVILFPFQSVGLL